MVRSLACGLLVLTSTSRAKAGDRLSAAVTRSDLYLGESTTLTVGVHGAEKSEPPDLGEISACRIEPLGSRRENRPAIVVRNGEPEPQSATSRVYLFKVTPDQAGQIALGPIHAQVDGTKVSVAGPVLRVVAPAKSPHVRVRLIASRQRVLVTESFEVVIEVELDDPIGGRAHETLDIRTPPQLDIPFLSIAQTRGIRGPKPRDLLGPRMVRQETEPAFGINGYTVRVNAGEKGVFDIAGITGDTPAAFRLDRDKVQRGGATATIYRLKLPFVALEEGTYELEPVAFKGPVMVVTGTDVSPQRVYTLSAPVEIRVDSPPAAGRPSTYSGAVGRDQTATARLATNTCVFGEPVALSLRLEGGIGFENTSPPKLGDHPLLEGRFHLYAGNIAYDESGHGADFGYILRALEPGMLELPSLDIAYYNTESRSYETVHTEPLPLYVAPAPENAAHGTAAAAGIRATLGQPVSEDIRFLWSAANARVGAARSEAEFAAAARLYDRIAAAGVRSPALFFNAGTAWLAAGRSERALERFRLAEIRMGWDTDLTYNTRLAAAQADPAFVRPRWMNGLLAWHYGLSVGTRAAGLIVIAVLLIALTILWAKTRRPGLRAATITCALVALALAASVLSSRHAEHTALRHLSAGEETRR